MKKTIADKSTKRVVKAQPPGGKVQPEKHQTVKSDRGEFKFREPKSSDWK